MKNGSLSAKQQCPESEEEEEETPSSISRQVEGLPAKNRRFNNEKEEILSILSSDRSHSEPSVLILYPNMNRNMLQLAAVPRLLWDVRRRGEKREASRLTINQKANGSPGGPRLVVTPSAGGGQESTLATPPRLQLEDKSDSSPGKKLLCLFVTSSSGARSGRGDDLRPGSPAPRPQPQQQLPRQRSPLRRLRTSSSAALPQPSPRRTTIHRRPWTS